MRLIDVVSSCCAVPCIATHRRQSDEVTAIGVCPVEPGKNILTFRANRQVSAALR
jgi:hypothetical protein